MKTNINIKMERKLDTFIKDLRSRGRYSFTLEETRQFLAITDNAAKQALYRYQKKGEIVNNPHFEVPPFKPQSLSLGVTDSRCDRNNQNRAVYNFLPVN